MKDRPLTYELARKEFRKIIGLPIQTMFRSYGTWLWIDFGVMRSFKEVNRKTGEVFEGKEGDFTLEFEGRWVHKKGGKTLLDPTRLMLEADPVQAGKTIDQYVSQIRSNHVTDVVFDDKQAVEFAFDDGTSIRVTTDEVGLVNLHNRVESTITYFDIGRGEFFQQKTLSPDDGRQG
jgi:hypothetical protein